MDRVSRSMLFRFLSGFMALWLFVLPQIICSSTMLSLNAEYGTAPLSLVEEEEIHHSGIPPLMTAGVHHAPGDADELELPHWAELLLHTLHGEVPHPPPWA